MAHVTVINGEQIQVVLPPAAAPGLVMPEPPAEQVRAAEAVFAHDAESEAVAGLLGLWSGTLILHGLAVDAFASTEEDEKKKPRPEDRDPEPENDHPKL